MDVIINESDLMEALDTNKVTFHLRTPSDIDPSSVSEILAKNKERLASTSHDVDLTKLFDD